MTLEMTTDEMTGEQPQAAVAETDGDQRAERGADRRGERSADRSSEHSAEPAGPRFTDLGLDRRVLAAVEAMGYTEPSAIQAETIPLLTQGRDVVGLAQTGTGKTAAFALPALSHMAHLADAGDLGGPGTGPQTLVLAPTRELAIQVAEAFTTYAEQVPEISVLPIYGGSPYGPQLHGLRKGANVVVGTPGRVIDHMTKGSLDLSGIQHLVLDEADEMLRMGFAEEVDRILAETPAQKQVALFSATMPNAIRRISAQYLDDPAEVSVKAKTSTSSTIRQRFVLIKHAAKLEALTRIMEVEPHDGAIVFVRTKAATEEVANRLIAQGLRAAAINGDIPQNLREKTVENLREGRVDVLVATDVAARGLDVERISHVYNYDIPMDTESYVHRIGRTGRAGRSGEAVLFVTPRERRMLKNIERATRQKVEQMTMPSIDEVNQARLSRFSERISRTLAESGQGGEKLEQYRDLIEDYVAAHDADAVQVASALIAMMHQGRPLLLDAQGDDDLVRESKREFDGAAGSSGRDGGRGRGSRERGPRQPAAGRAMYRIALGRKDGVAPGHIVGAIANEADISAREIGSIDIRPTHSIVELPEQLSGQQWDALAKTRISGELIKLERDQGAPGGGGFRAGDRFGGRGGKKPHRKDGGFSQGDRRQDRKPRWRDR